MVGQIISMDAFHCDQPLRGTLEQIGENAEAYDAILQRAISTVAEFSQNQDREALRRAVSEIKEKLAALD
jgi:hypothetical protein